MKRLWFPWMWEWSESKWQRRLGWLNRNGAARHKKCNVKCRFAGDCVADWGGHSVFSWGILLYVISWEANCEKAFCKESSIGCALRINFCGGSKTSRMRPRERLGCQAVKKKISADLAGSAEAGVAPQIGPDLRHQSQDAVQPRWRCVTLGEVDVFDWGKFLEGTDSSAVRQQHSCKSGSRSFSPGGGCGWLDPASTTGYAWKILVNTSVRPPTG